MTYEIVRAGRAHLVREVETGELIQTRTLREASAWIARAERSAANDSWWAEHTRKAREAEAEVKRAARKARAAEKAKQGALFADLPARRRPSLMERRQMSLF